MEKNIRKKFKSYKGITLVALVITIIVLLILAGVALSSVLSQDGIFHRAEQATDKYGEAKARETLELALGEAQMQKYDEGLTDEQLTEKINTIGEELPKEKLEHPELQNVIVDGHIFEIDRSVPKIVDYIGPADGVIITAQITQNGWPNPTATITGTITKYGGGSVTSVAATATNGVTIPSNFPTTGGSYTIPNITTDTDITITASADDGKPAVNKKIEVRLVKDTTPPTISNATATASGMKITISARATDSESGLQSLKYKIEPNTIKEAEDGTSRVEGLLTSGEQIEIETTEEGEYTIISIAKDNAGNPTNPGETLTVTTIDVISIADLKKEINKNNFIEYIGKKVEYKPKAGGTWRVFYYDTGDASHTNGYFGDGIGTIYLKRDYNYDNKIKLKSYSGHSSSDSGALMGQLNPKWKNSSYNGIDLATERCVSWLCDPKVWNEQYKTSEAKYAVGAPSIEMFMKAYNAYKGSEILKCEISNQYGYKIGTDDSGLGSSVPGPIDSGKGKIFCPDLLWTGMWLASTFAGGGFYGNLGVVTTNSITGQSGGENDTGVLSQVVCLQK